MIKYINVWKLLCSSLVLFFYGFGLDSVSSILALALELVLVDLVSEIF